MPILDTHSRRRAVPPLADRFRIKARVPVAVGLAALRVLPPPFRQGIFGIVLASTLVIVPTDYVALWEIVLSAVCCIGGFLLAYFMARLDKRIQENGG